MNEKSDTEAVKYPDASNSVRIKPQEWKSRKRVATQSIRRNGAACQTKQQVNVSETERIISLIAGTALAGVGLSKRSVAGLLVAGLGGALAYRGTTGHCNLYEATGIDTSHPTDMDHLEETGVTVSECFLINKTSQELYEYWRNFERLPSFMSHLKSVRQLDKTRSEWIAKAPAIAGGEVHWSAEIVDDHQNKMIRWQTLPGVGVEHKGSITFTEASGDRGTNVRIDLAYAPPAGQMGRWIAKLFGEEPEQQIRSDLRKFKQLMEAGEIPTVAGQPRGNCHGVGGFFGN